MQQVALKPQFEWAARLGYASRGIIYLVIGGLALGTAFSGGGETTGSRGALQTLLEQPFGKGIVTLLALGLICYAAWRATQAISDTDEHGSDLKGMGIRAGMMASALAHLLLGIWAFSLVLSGAVASSASSGGSSGTSLSMWGLSVLGLGVIAAGIAYFISGWQARFEKYLKIPPDYESWAKPVCRFGLISRGVVYALVGIFILSSVWLSGGQEIKGIGDALSWLYSQTFGVWLLGLTALGLLSFGVYSLLEAVYRRVDA